MRVPSQLAGTARSLVAKVRVSAERDGDVMILTLPVLEDYQAIVIE